VKAKKKRKKVGGLGGTFLNYMHYFFKKGVKEL
jgi:hypothetical protein